MERVESTDGIFRQILEDLMDVSSADLETLAVRQRTDENRISLDEAAFRSGLISIDDRDLILRSYLERRKSDLRDKLLGATLGSYHILDEISGGGMGVVFKARQESPMFTREVAIKFMLPATSGDPEERERFMSEAKGLASLSHPSLVSIFDSGIEGDLYYFTMELVDGWALSDVPSHVRLSQLDKVRIARDVANALVYLHDNGVIHRDVKPANVMVDHHGNTKLLDFGISQFSTDPRRRSVQAGTPHYMAPEVVEPHGAYGPIGPGTDIYALGAVLYQLLVGQEVFAGEGGVSGVFERTLRDAPEFPRARGRRLPPELERIVTRCLRKRVDERYPSAREVSIDLDAFLRRKRLAQPVMAAISGAAAVVILGLLVIAPESSESSASGAARIDLAPYEARAAAIDVLGREGRDTARELRSLLDPTATSGLIARLERFDRTANAFWREQVRRALDEASRARDEFFAVPVPADEGLRDTLRSARQKLEEAARRRADAVAHGLLVRAAAEFRVARSHAESRLRDIERESALTSARNDALRARERAERERENAATKPRVPHPASVKDQLTKAHATWDAADNHFREKEYQEATDAYGRAEEEFYRASRAAEDHFDRERRRLDDAVHSSMAEYTAARSLIQRNTPALASRLETARPRILNLLEAGNLDAVETELATFDDSLSRAREEVRSIESEAERYREGAAKLLLEGRFAAPLREMVARARQFYGSGVQAGEEEDFDGARRSFRSSFSSARDAILETRRLTEGMAWIPSARFWIDRLEFTVGEYARFLEDISKRGPSDGHEPFGWRDQLLSPEARSLPVTGVALADALACAEWRGKVLPPASVWRLAARARPDGPSTAYPYGDEFDPRRTNHGGPDDDHPGLAPAESFPDGASGFGCLHLSGNAAEWALRDDGVGVVLGGSYLCAEEEYLRSDARGELETDARIETRYATRSAREPYRAVGFRLALEALPAPRLDGGEE